MSAYCTNLINRGGTLIESEINKKRITNTLNSWIKKAENPSNSIYTRVINLRKYYEYVDVDNSDLVFNILSSIEHKKGKPTYSKNGRKQLSVLDRRKGNKLIKQAIKDFKYNKVLSEFKNYKKIKNEYLKSTNNINKMELARLLIINNPKVNNVIRNFITSTYHADNNEMFGLDDNCFDIIPDYIIKMCDEIINKI